MIHFSMMPHRYLLDEVSVKFKENNYDKIRLFIDLRNSVPIFFDEHAAKLLLKDPKSSIISFVDSVFSFMNYILSAFNYNTEIEFIFFYEKGRSEYHRSISKDYKANRHNSYLVLSPDEVERINDLNIKCFDALYETLDNFNNPSVVKMNYFEADFIPHYFINKMDKEFDNKINYMNLILSNDKDMYQTIADNTFCIKKEFRAKKSILITKDNMYSVLLKDEKCINFNYDVNYIADILSLAGDEADGVKGLNKVGYKTAYNFLKHFDIRLSAFMDKYKLSSDITEYDKIPKRIRNVIDSVFDNKDQLKNNLKLVDYNIIQEHVELVPYKYLRDKYKTILDNSSVDIKKVINDLLILPNLYTTLLSYFLNSEKNNNAIEDYENSYNAKFNSSVFDNHSTTSNNNSSFTFNNKKKSKISINNLL